jgi:hypothetical protein
MTVPGISCRKMQRDARCFEPNELGNLSAWRKAFMLSFHQFCFKTFEWFEKHGVELKIEGRRMFPVEFFTKRLLIVLKATQKLGTVPDKGTIIFKKENEWKNRNPN